MSSSNLNISFSSSKHSVAGHDGTLVAPGVFAKKTTAQEFDFYQQLQKIDGEKSHPDILTGDLLSDWVPRFYGSLTENKLQLDISEIQGSLEAFQVTPDSIPKSVTPTEKKYLVLSNLYDGYLCPSIMDIKLGAVLTDENASLEKVERLKKVSQDTTSSTLNFRLCGMKVYHLGKEIPDLDAFEDVNDTVSIVEDENERYWKFDKYFGRKLTDDTVKQAIRLYIFAGAPSKEHGVHFLLMFWKRLQLLYNCLLNYELRVISGSLLFITENSAEALSKYEDLEQADPLVSEVILDDEDEDEYIPKISSLHMIDFAHAKLEKGLGVDDNIMTGIENLISIFSELLEEEGVVV